MIQILEIKPTFSHVLFHVVAERKFPGSIGLGAHLALVSEDKENNENHNLELGTSCSIAH